MDNKKYFGKYPGIVTRNIDPMMRGRITAFVPHVLGEQESTWAEPCAPFGLFALPTVNAGVWIEFEGGDPARPIWSGCRWRSADEIPYNETPYEKVLLVSKGGNKIILDDTSETAAILLETSGGQKIKLSRIGIEIENGYGATIKLSGPTVKINEEALEIT
jgi:uncharacterized protein involved in type VI secretion and phage assembly